MADFIAELKCDYCGTAYSVGLEKMRSDSCIYCPCCSFRYHMTDAKAIKAHRLLDRLIRDTKGTALSSEDFLRL